MPQRASSVLEYDVIIIGSGASGLSAALRIDPGARVAVLSKGNLDAGSTTWAQGGVAAVLDERKDSFESHVHDTLAAGGGLCHPDSVERIISEAPATVDWLTAQGVKFDRYEADESQFHLTREGGHSARRVIHAADATGREIESVLIDRLQAARNIDTYDYHLAVDLITGARFGLADNRCLGAYVLDARDGVVDQFRARQVVLATGGASKVYLYSTNPDGATGDGIAMAWRAGCRVANLEFNQFHPTCLFHPHAKSFLITEAVRGEGGMLLLPDGRRFMDRFHPAAELAPRDVVARAIDHEMKRLGVDCVYLDITDKPAGFVQRHFPTIHRRCLDLGIDMTREPLPVVPAAHYTCGGVVVDVNGRTDVPGLYAIGETSFTGLHGANRMASNSLLECFVSASGCAACIDDALANTERREVALRIEIPEWDDSRVTDSDEDVVISHNWDELRRCMWDYVGIVRTTKRLLRAQHRVEMLQREIDEFYANYRLSPDFIELRNLIVVADLIVRSALQRRESRGLHYTLDYPEPASVAVDTVLHAENGRAIAESPLVEVSG